MHPRERRKRALIGLERCENRYMLRRKLEPKLDLLLGEKLREPAFLRRIVEQYNEQQVHPNPSMKNERELTARLEVLAGKRRRVLETFFEGVIDKEERDRRIGEIDRETKVFQDLAMEVVPPVQSRSLDAIQAALEPLAEWEFLEREDKRSLLRALCPEISVFQYMVKSLTLNLGTEPAGRNEVSHLKMAR